MRIKRLDVLSEWVATGQTCLNYVRKLAQLINAVKQLSPPQPLRETAFVVLFDMTFSPVDMSWNSDSYAHS